VALRAGISPQEFWNLTPYLTRLAIDAKVETQMTYLWVQAGLIRAKKMPDLKRFLARKETTGDLATRMKQAFLEHNARIGRK